LPSGVLPRPCLETAFELRTLEYRRGIIELLLANGADPNAEDRQGSTPLMAARNVSTTLMEAVQGKKEEQ